MNNMNEWVLRALDRNRIAIYITASNIVNWMSEEMISEVNQLISNCYSSQTKETVV